MADEAFPAITAAVAEALAEIAADPVPEHAYQRASALGTFARELLNATALARGRALRVIKERDRLSFSELAEAFEMSKSRAAQLVMAVDE